MIIYRDLINHDEMISNIYKIREVTGVGWGAVSAGGGEGSRTEGNTDDLPPLKAGRAKVPKAQ